MILLDTRRPFRPGFLSRCSVFCLPFFALFWGHFLLGLFSSFRCFHVCLVFYSPVFRIAPVRLFPVFLFPVMECGPCWCFVLFRPVISLRNPEHIRLSWNEHPLAQCLDIMTSETLSGRWRGLERLCLVVPGVPRVAWLVKVAGKASVFFRHALGRSIRPSFNTIRGRGKPCRLSRAWRTYRPRAGSRAG